MPSTGSWTKLFKIGKTVLEEFQPALRFLDQARAPRDGALVAIDADDARAGSFQDQAAIAAGAERAVDIKAAALHVQPADRLAAEHGNMTRRAVALIPALPSRRALCSVAAASSARKRVGSQI